MCVCVCVCVWYHQVKAACADQTQRMQQMQTLAMQLEGSRDIQGEQLRQANHLRAEAEGQHRAALEDLSRARTSCAEREEEVLGLQRALAKLDEERDILQRELDRQSEELATVRTRDDALRSELERAGTAYSELQRALDDHRRALASREQEVRRVVGRLLATRCMSPFRAVDLTSPVCVWLCAWGQVEALTGQLEAAQAQAAEALDSSTATQQEVAAAAADLASMTRENQVVSTELMQLRVELRNQQNMVQQLSTTNADSNRAANALRRRYVRAALLPCPPALPPVPMVVPMRASPVVYVCDGCAPVGAG